MKKENNKPMKKEKMKHDDKKEDMKMIKSKVKKGCMK
jgi:hypothetical protein